MNAEIVYFKRVNTLADTFTLISADQNKGSFKYKSSTSLIALVGIISDDANNKVTFSIT